MTPQNYRDLFTDCKLTTDPKQLRELEYICKVVLANQTLYTAVERLIQVPWPLVSAIHFRESSLNFRCHLHNGDPLSARTIHVPRGRPEIGEPPFTWVESAVDAFLDQWFPPIWDLAGSLEFLERYNGLGYQKRGINSPYLWDFTDKYVSGLYVADGQFDPFKVENRAGCVAILKSLVKKGVTTLDFASSVGGDITLH